MYISSETLTTGRMISSVTPPAEVYLQWNTDYWADDILGHSTSRGISPVKHWLLGGWYPRWPHQQRYISSETLTTGRMISAMTPPAEVYRQLNTDYWADDILGDSTSRCISPVKHWLLGGWYPRWLHQQRYISSETLTTGRMISSVTPPAEVYLQWNTDFWANDILGQSTSRGISPAKHWLLGEWYPRWPHQQRYISSETLTTGRMISSMTQPAEVYLQLNTDYRVDDILCDSTSRVISPVKHWLLGGWYPRWLHQQRYISSETLTTGRMISPVTPAAEVYLQWNTDYWAVPRWFHQWRMISSVTPPAEVYLQWNTDYWANDILGDPTSRGISPVKHWLLGGWFPRWLHQHRYISSETLTTGWMISSVTPPAGLYLQWNTDYWADDILVDSTTRGIYPVKHWLLGGWYPRWLHQQRYISSETLTTGRMISAMTPPAEVYLQWNTDYWEDDILGDSTSRGISPVKHWLLGGWYPRWLHQQMYISSETLTTGWMISSVTPPAEVYLQWNTDYWADDIRDDSTSRGISPVKHWLLGGWYPRWLHQQSYISSETLTTGRMKSSVTPPAEVYIQWNTDYWADDILGNPTSRGISPVKHWLLSEWYPRWLHQQRYISS